MGVLDWFYFIVDMFGSAIAWADSFVLFAGVTLLDLVVVSLVISLMVSVFVAVGKISND